MHYLIKQALAGTTEEIKEPSIDLDGSSYVLFPGYIHTFLLDTGGPIGSIGINGPQGEPGALSITVNEGDRFDIYRYQISQLMDTYWEKVSEEWSEEVDKTYGLENVLDTEGLKVWLEECDVLMSNGTFAAEYDLLDLVESYFDGYM